MLRISLTNTYFPWENLCTSFHIREKLLARHNSCCHKISIKAGKLRPEYELIPINIRLYLRYFPPPFPLITHIYRSYIFLRISNSFYWFFYVLFSFCLCLFLPLLLLIIGLLCFCFCICFCFSFFMLGIFFF